MIKKGSIAIGKEMLSGASNVIGDVVSDRVSFKEAMQNRGKEGLLNLKRKADAKMSGSGLKKRKLKKIQSSAKVVKNKTSKKKNKSLKSKTNKKKGKKSIKKEKNIEENFSYF